MRASVTWYKTVASFIPLSGEIRSLRLLDSLKLNLKKKATQGNNYIRDLFKIFFGNFCVCICVRNAGRSLKPPTRPVCYRHMVNQLGNCTWTSHSYMVDRSSCRCCNRGCHYLQIEKKHAISNSFIQKQRLSLKKLKVNQNSNGNIISKLWTSNY